jgi:uncharacterized membrane protein
MISIAGLTFSITIVTLSLASGQYTSRILRNFIRDRANQVVLGVYLSNYVYCLIVLRAIRGGEDSFVPAVAVVTGIALGIVGIAFLIFFIHHIATSIQASTIISRIAAETRAVIDDLYPDEHAGEHESDEETVRCVRAHVWRDVPARDDGYVQTADHGRLIAWAERRGTIVRMARGIGEFAVENGPLVQVPENVQVSEDDIAELNACFSLAAYRTIEQDVAFGIRQIVDVALKALSPGVNDTTTAVTCLHYLSAILKRLSTRKIPAELCRRGGHIRHAMRSHTCPFLVDEALHQSRQDAGRNVAVLLALIEAIEAARHPRLSMDRWDVLEQHGRRIREMATSHIKDRDELETVCTRLDAVVRPMASKPSPS